MRKRKKDKQLAHKIENRTFYTEKAFKCTEVMVLLGVFMMLGLQLRICRHSTNFSFCNTLRHHAKEAIPSKADMGQNVPCRAKERTSGATAT